MKPPFNVPGKYSSFFQENDGGKEEGTNQDAHTNFKVSWFEEQVDTFVSRRIVSNYQVYNYEQGGPNEVPSENVKQSGDAQGQSTQLENKILLFPEEKDKKDILSNFLEKLFTYSMDKLMANGPSRNIDLRPCEVVAGISTAVSSSNVENCRDKCSKSYYDASEESPEASGDVVPLTALEMFIKNAMDDSLAKFKEEINKAIDHKFESLRTIPQSGTSLSGDTDGKLVIGDSSADSPLYTCAGSTDFEEKMRGSLSADIAAVYDNVTEKECKIFNLIQPEVRNVIFGRDSASFQSESVNVIKKNLSNSSLTKSANLLDDSNKAVNEDKPVANESEKLSNAVNKVSLVNEKTENDEDKQKEEFCMFEIGDDANKVAPECDDSSENCIAEAIKKSANPKLMTDMTKFMYIIFESFRRLKEENVRRELECCSGTETLNSSCGSKDGARSDNEAKEDTESESSKKQETCSNVEGSVKEENDTVTMSATVVTETAISPLSSEFFGKCSQDERPIIFSNGDGNAYDNNCQLNNQVSTIGLENSEPASLSDMNEDSGYVVQKFKKNSFGYKPTASSKMLENLKELYLQNLNSIEQKMMSAYDCGEKYKCRIKKKFSPGDNRIGTRLDSKFYCNLRSKTIEKKKASEMSMQKLNSKMRSKGSSNIISVRHSLIKNRNKSTFKNVSKKREISLDSTVISLLDINLKNKSSWIKKLSSLSSETSCEEEKNEEKVNILKRLCLITFTWGKRHNKHVSQLMDQHLSNIYNAICLDFVTDDVYKSVLFVSDQLRSGGQKNKDEIMRRWVKICNKPLNKDRKSFNLDCLHQIWVQFRTKIWHLARPPPIIPPNFFPALTYPSEENRLIKEQVIQKYARDILEYISDPKLYKHSVSLYSNNSLL